MLGVLVGLSLGADRSSKLEGVGAKKVTREGVMRGLLLPVVYFSRGCLPPAALVRLWKHCTSHQDHGPSIPTSLPCDTIKSRQCLGFGVICPSTIEL